MTLIDRIIAVAPGVRTIFGRFKMSVLNASNGSTRTSTMILQRHSALPAAVLLLNLLGQISAAIADDETSRQRIQEEVWALPLPLPMFAYVVRPVGDGPLPLVIMNHGVSLNARERSFFPLVEFRDAAFWFARRGYLVVAPTGSGCGAAAIDLPERGIYGPFFSKVGNCINPNFRDPGLAVAKVDTWIIDYMAAEKRIVPKDVIVVGQSAGGWAAIALASQNPPQVRAIITLRRAVAVASMASRTTIARPINWLRPRVSSAVPPRCPCCGSTPRTILASDPLYPGGCETRTRALAARPNTTCCPPSATKDIF